MSLRVLRYLQLVLLLMMGVCEGAFAQWGAPYTNSWITYDQPYVKLKVSQKGVYRVPFSALPAGFPVNQPEKLQLWHRGTQVAILSVANNEILFYGIPNDGALDSLLYRPMSSRLNPYTSLYSDESSYFLTVGKVNGLRAETVGSASGSGVAVESHMQTDVKAFANEYSLSTLSAIRANFFNSFFENGASKTGVTVLPGKSVTYNFQLTKRVTGTKPQVKLMVHGRSNNSRSIEVYVGKTESAVRKVGAIPNANFVASVYSFELEEADLTADGSGIFLLKSVSSDSRDRFSLAYYAITYNQASSIGTEKSLEFNFPKTSDATTHAKIAGTLPTSKLYDISNPDIPRIIPGTGADFTVPRIKDKALKLLLTNEVLSISANKINSVTLIKPDVKKYNYLIVTNQTLEEGAKTYAAYRASTEGGAFVPLVIRITDIYDQFNYGEPSPVGIRRFVDYMLSDNNREKYLFLMGKSITFNERMVRELPEEVPTIGFPGSDVLLVEGLAGAPREVPAIPVGRLSALTNQHVYDYLAKVKEYEHSNVQDVSWKKNILHLNGGKSSSEITQLKNILAGLAPQAEKGYIGAKVTPFVKKQGIGEVESVNITPEINAGVGLLTYFGHGSTTVTDLDIGYITDAARAYNNQGKYPLLYFNGCGVGNVFSARFNTSPSSSDRIALSLDWILAAKRGTVALIANTFDTYVSSTSNYLDKLYTTLFLDANTSKQSIGKVQLEVAKRIFADGYNAYDVANVHQALLQGDPALKMIYVASPDYSVDPDESILIYSESSDKTIEKSATLTAAIAIKNQGKYNAGEKLPVELTYGFQDGTTEVKSQTVAAIPYSDTIRITFPNKGALKFVQVRLDRANVIQEINESNNITELTVDWEIAKTQHIYPAERVKDIIAPVLNVTFNERVIEDGEDVGAKPTIKFVLTDDRLMSADTNLMDIFIKPCLDNTCDFKKLGYKNLVVTKLGDRVIQVEYRTDLSLVGGYELLVNTQDNSGNAAANPYQIKFRIGEGDEGLALIASPNPATDYVRFRIKGFKLETVQQVQYIIYDSRGIKLLDHSFKPVSTLSDWYWTSDIGSGMYVYKAIVSKSDGSKQTITGRVNILR
ncbi:C25 family cysteine peptidase [Dyadobacter sp. BHUBP1]|uniref:putative type IX secretion system sortase PorU2 n=1 Tax=Dyadobacter sp. BHUBP1 TaxID=3424178 RepID=UPI003D355454